MLIPFLSTFLIVGIVTSGLNIKFDRFFTILLLLFLFKFNIHTSVDVFLWVILFGALMILFKNIDKILDLPSSKKKKMFTIIPGLTFIATFIGTYFFIRSTEFVLIVILAILSILYGIRLINIHFKKHEMNLQNPNIKIQKICSLFGPIISGFFISFIGTSLKPLKIPFAIKIGKMNLKQVYLGNVLSTFFASSFAIMWHFVLSNSITENIFYTNLLLGAGLWTTIHYTSEFTDLFFKDKWKKTFQIIIGLALLLVAIKLLILIK